MFFTCIGSCMKQPTGISITTVKGKCSNNECAGFMINVSHVIQIQGIVILLEIKQTNQVLKLYQAVYLFSVESFTE